MLLISIAAVLPALLLLLFVYRQDSIPEPRNIVVKGLIFGGLATFASTLISTLFFNLGLFVNEPETVGEAIKTAFFGAAIPEECAKLFMLWLLLRHNPYFDEKYDGIVYAASVGLGFAAFENLLYVISAGAGWFSVAVSRAFLAIPGHFAFAVMMGYYYSLYHFYGSDAPTGTKTKVLLVPILLHGTYDSICFISDLNAAWSGVLTLVLLYFCIRMFKATRAKIISEAEKNREENEFWRNSAPDDEEPDDQ